MYAEETFAYCSGQCQASRSPPVLCRCVCGGQNHGSLQRRRIIDIRHAKTHDEQFNDWMERFEQPKQIPAQGQLPYIQPKIEKPKVETERLIFPVARGTKRFLKKITGYRSQDDMNSAIRDGLRKQFNEENTDKAILQAFTIRQSRQPDANRPELYELYETGEIDEALEMIGKRWVIGRPKLKH